MRTPNAASVTTAIRTSVLRAIKEPEFVFPTNRLTAPANLTCLAVAGTGQLSPSDFSYRLLPKREITYQDKNELLTVLPVNEQGELPSNILSVLQKATRALAGSDNTLVSHMAKGGYDLTILPLPEGLQAHYNCLSNHLFFDQDWLGQVGVAEIQAGIRDILTAGERVAGFLQAFPFPWELSLRHVQEKTLWQQINGVWKCGSRYAFPRDFKTPLGYFGQQITVGEILHKTTGYVIADLLNPDQRLANIKTFWTGDIQTEVNQKALETDVWKNWAGKRAGFFENQREAFRDRVYQKVGDRDSGLTRECMSAFTRLISLACLMNLLPEVAAEKIPAKPAESNRPPRSSRSGNELTQEVLDDQRRFELALISVEDTMAPWGRYYSGPR